MKTGLVLGAGGVAGGAWLTGALDALATETGWDPGSADHVVGTSAGSVIGAFVASGVPPWFMVAHSQGEVFDGLTGPDGRLASDADRSGGAVFKLQKTLPPIGPGSWRLALSSLTRPQRTTPAAMAVGWLPRGFISTDAIKGIVRRTLRGRWVDHASYTAVACDYATGRRVAFGRAGAPEAELGDAVAASCAIPGFYYPVTIQGRRYVDGGVCSASNLDLLAGAGLDLVICLNPTSGRDMPVSRHPVDRLLHVNRGVSGRRLGHEVKKVRAGGADVLVIEPSAEDLAVIGRNMMSGARRNEVIESARRSVTDLLRRPLVARRLAGLPVGEAHKVARPTGPIADWPEVLPGMTVTPRVPSPAGGETAPADDEPPPAVVAA